MKGKSPSCLSGNVASSTLAYPGNSFKYSPKFPTEDPQQKLYVFDAVPTTLQRRAANASSSVCSNSLANSLVVPPSTEKTQNELSNDISDARSLQRQTRPPSQKCDEIYPLPQEDTLGSSGQNQDNIQTEKVIVEVLKKVEDIQELDHCCREQTKEVRNGPKIYKN